MGSYNSNKKGRGAVSLPDEVNILVLGKSGVGKSTWINSIVNYLQYDTLDEAQAGGVQHVLPASFMYVSKIGKQLVEIGSKDANEVLKSGKSATRGSKTYTFESEDTFYRIIDTPGLGDNEGIDVDRAHMKNILEHISHLKEIHAICILMKSNETRLDAIFKYCLKELLAHLHRNAARNIIFCFTHSRATFYTAGDTSDILETYLQESELTDLLALSEDTVFCLDNEAFRYLCCLKYPNIKFSPTEQRSYVDSWERSVEETKNLFRAIRSLTPHPIADTTTLNSARERILNLTVPLAEITKLVQENLTAIKLQEEELSRTNHSIDDLKNKLFVPHIDLQSTPLSRPRTVCTNSSCVKYHTNGNQAQIVEYTTHCHPECYLQNVTPETYPNPDLQHCWAMNGKGDDCRTCRCSWEKHMHITYEQTKVTINQKDESVDKKINEHTSKAALLADAKDKLKRKNQQLEAEEKRIVEICKQFAYFLKENAITAYNDAFKDYLKYLIKQEENKINATKGDKDLLQRLKDMMARYEQEVRIFEKYMKDNSYRGKKMAPGDVLKLEQELYSLPLFGDSIRKNVQVASQSNRQAKAYVEQKLPVKKTGGFFRMFQK